MSKSKCVTAAISVKIEFLADRSRPYLLVRSRLCDRLASVVVCTECIVAKRCVLEQKCKYIDYRPICNF